MSSINVTSTDIAALPELISVEMPCLVKDVDTVNDIFGGSEILHCSLRDNSASLAARMPGTDIMRRPLNGNKSTCQGLLLRVRRKRGDKSNSSLETSVVGRVTSAYSFHNPLEYQVY
jgi:hypothetical protein